MDVRILILLVILRQQEVTASISISGDVSEDITFLHKTFPVPPSTRAIIEVDVSYPISSFQRHLIDPILGIYTTKDHINIKKQCTYVRYSQVGNGQLHPRIRLDDSDMGPPKCLEHPQGTIHCKGNITIQDFKPRNFSFSFGFRCDRITSSCSLKGLVYNITIHEQTKENNCINLKGKGTDLCTHFYQHGFLPNLVGSENMLAVSRYRELYKTYAIISESFCYEHFSEFGCRIILPECNPESRQVIHPCREMCKDWRKACSKITLPRSVISGTFPNISSDENTVTLNGSFISLNCNYLPSINGDIPCFYKPVHCNHPPVVKNATLVSTNSQQKDTYSVFDTLEYSCDEGFNLKGNKTVTCNYKGQWSTSPKCSLNPINKSRLPSIVLPIFLMLLLIMFLIAACKNRIQMRINNKASTRNRQYDAFVCYCYEGQDPDFAEKIISQELEEEHNLKLCVHRRDFKAGWDIKWNIMNAIRNSNSAIIIMSQDYLNSLWCLEEFEDCYMENMKDPAFKLFVILMQPADTLDITNEYIQSFFSKKTYLERDDPKLFKKIAEYLIQVKQMQKAPEGGIGEAMDPLLENNVPSEAQNSVKLMLENERGTIELKHLNNRICIDGDHLDNDDDVDNNNNNNNVLLENRDINAILDNKKNYEIMETVVEVHNDNVGGIGSLQE